MSERFGPNFAPGPFALHQSIRLVYTLRALSRGRNRATRATSDNQDAHTERAHTRSATETQHNRQPETPKGSWPLLLPRRHHRRPCCCCCCCCCFCAAASRPVMHRGAQPVTTDCFSFCVFWNARRSEYRHSSSSSSSSSDSGGGGGGGTAAAGPATGEAKTYVRVYY